MGESGETMFRYIEKVKEQIDVIIDNESEVISEFSNLIAKTIEEDKIIHVCGTGHSHMVGLELFIRAGGLANVNAMLDSVFLTSDGARRSCELERLPGMAKIIWDNHKIEKGDIIIIISNSGRNAVPIEMAMLAKEKKLKIVVITSIEQSKQSKSRHESGKKLYEFADILIDNHVPTGDGSIKIGDVKTGSLSTLSGILIVNTAVTEAMEICYKKGISLPVYGSQNIDGVNNEELFNRFSGRIKHM